MITRFGVNRVYWNSMKAPHWPSFDQLVNSEFDELDKSYKNDILKRHYHNPSYHPSMNQVARHRIDILDNIDNSYSQSMQDIFVLTLLNGKLNGTYLELGASEPINYNNTYLISTLGWNGISIDNQEFLIPLWKKDRPESSFICQDAFNIDYNVLFKKYNLPNQIDFLQVDVDHEDQSVLLDSLFLTGHRFSLIMYETDMFLGPAEKNKAEKILVRNNYKKLIENIVCKDFSMDQMVPFEDWWIDADYIDADIQEKFLTVNLEKVYPFELFCMPGSVDHLMDNILSQKNIWNNYD